MWRASFFDFPVNDMAKIPIHCRHLTLWTPPWQIAFDPFSGSGTTLVTCEQMKRSGRAIEQDPGYVAVALERLAEMGLTPKLLK